jgi:hypothetical protein
MKTPTPIFSKHSRSRLGLSGAVVALILVVIGIAVTLIVGSVVGGVIGGWARKEGIVIENIQASLSVSGMGRLLCVQAQVKNVGSSRVTDMGADLSGVGGFGSIYQNWVDPGQSLAFHGCWWVGSNINRGDTVTVLVYGRVPSGSVADRRTVPVT